MHCDWAKGIVVQEMSLHAKDKDLTLGRWPLLSIKFVSGKTNLLCVLSIVALLAPLSNQPRYEGMEECACSFAMILLLRYDESIPEVSRGPCE